MLFALLLLLFLFSIHSHMNTKSGLRSPWAKISLCVYNNSQTNVRLLIFFFLDLTSVTFLRGDCLFAKMEHQPAQVLKWTGYIFFGSIVTFLIASGGIK